VISDDAHGRDLRQIRVHEADQLLGGVFGSGWIFGVSASPAAFRSHARPNRSINSARTLGSFPAVTACVYAGQLTVAPIAVFRPCDQGLADLGSDGVLGREPER
jgi:hypothetical protein